MKSSTPLVPPFTRRSALAKVRAAEDAWNLCDPQRVAMAYSEDSEWRNRGVFLRGREQIREFLTGKWDHEFEYRLTKALWSFTDNRIAVRFQYEYRTIEDKWFRAYGNELWEFDNAGLMRRREASINDVEIQETERKFHWPIGKPRPDNDAGIQTIR